MHSSPSLVVADLGSWWLPIKLPCTHCLTPQAHNHVGLKQSTSRSLADVGGSSSSGSAAADYLGCGQQGGSSADPGVDTLELLDDADEAAGSTVRCMLLFVFMFAHHVLVFVDHAFHACTRRTDALLMLYHREVTTLSAFCLARSPCRLLSSEV